MTDMENFIKKSEDFKLQVHPGSGIGMRAGEPVRGEAERGEVECVGGVEFVGGNLQ